MLEADQSHDRERAWRRFSCLFAFIFAGGLVVLVLACAFIDPYDSGHLPSLLPSGIMDGDPRTAAASRGRDPQFNAAIFGNSHAQLLDPRRLSASTGLQFVQMTVPGSGPREQATLLQWFATHHSDIGALILGVDQAWCDPAMPLAHPFPFWLYASAAEYVTHLLSQSTLERASRRVRLALGQATPTDPAGYWDYEAGRPWTFQPDARARPFIDLRAREPTQADNAALNLVEPLLSALPQRTKVIFVALLQFYDALPQARSNEAAEIVRCKQEILRRSIAHRWVFLDFFLDSDLARDPANFMDRGHFRAPVARLIERQIADALSPVRPGG